MPYLFVLYVQMCNQEGFQGMLGDRQVNLDAQRGLLLHGHLVQIVFGSKNLPYRTGLQGHELGSVLCMNLVVQPQFDYKHLVL